MQRSGELFGFSAADASACVGTDVIVGVVAAFLQELRGQHPALAQLAQGIGPAFGAVGGVEDEFQGGPGSQGPALVHAQDGKLVPVPTGGACKVDALIR